jgi:hypothetical protein
MDKKKTTKARKSKTAKAVRDLPMKAKQARKVKGGFGGSLFKSVKASKPTSGASLHDISIVKNVD